MRIRSCFQCVPPKRHAGCHSSCPDYIAEKAEYDAKKAARVKLKKAENDATGYLVDYAFKGKRRVRKK